MNVGREEFFGGETMAIRLWNEVEQSQKGEAHCLKHRH